MSIYIKKKNDNRKWIGKKNSEWFQLNTLIRYSYDIVYDDLFVIKYVEGNKLYQSTEM